MYRIQKKKKIISLCKEAIIAGIKEEMEVEDNIPKKKRKWIRDWVARRGEYVPIYKEVETEDRTKFFGDFRMFPDEFDQLLTRMEPLISKSETNMRSPIPAKLRLQVTLRFLASGASFSILEDIFRIPKPTLSIMIPEVCEAIWQELHKECIVIPQTASAWKVKSQEFLDLWQYPQALAAMDGKHCMVQAFKKSGSLYHNYKGHFSIILFALVDANYQFLYVDVGKPGSNNDATVWHTSTLKKALTSGKLNLPKSQGNVGYHFLGDDIFPLTTTLMKPYTRKENMAVAEKIFNYRCSRARRVVENCFGILGSRFRVLRSPILQSYQNAMKTVKAVVVMHNYIMQNFNKDKTYLNPSQLQREDVNGKITPGTWEQGNSSENLFKMRRLAGNQSGTQEAKNQRDLIARKMVTDGLAPWQFKHAFRTK